jgi:hypothetical protein
MPGAALARDLFAGGHVDDVDGEVGKLRRKGRREVVAAGLDEDQLDIGKSALQAVDGFEIDRGILADRRVRAAAGFDADDAFRRQRRVLDQKLGILGGVDVVGDHRHVDLIAQGLAEGQGQGGLAGTDGAADAYS